MINAILSYLYLLFSMNKDVLNSNDNSNNNNDLNR